MNPSYLMLRRPLEDAMARYGAWVGTPEVAPPREVRERDAIGLALDDDEQWKGMAVYVFASAPWTVFEELSGGLSGSPVEKWLALADGGDLIYLGFNDAIAYGELIWIEDGRVLRQFLEDEQEPGDDVNLGRLPGEATDPIEHWMDVEPWLQRQEDSFAEHGRGWLWIHEVR
jgi:hypothetical protein